MVNIDYLIESTRKEVHRETPKSTPKSTIPTKSRTAGGGKRPSRASKTDITKYMRPEAKAALANATTREYTPYTPKLSERLEGLEAKRKKIEREKKKLEAEKLQLQEMRKHIDVSDPQAVAAFNQKVAEFNKKSLELNKEVKKYNESVKDVEQKIKHIEDVVSPGSAMLAGGDIDTLERITKYEEEASSKSKIYKLGVDVEKGGGWVGKQLERALPLERIPVVGRGVEKGIAGVPTFLSMIPGAVLKTAGEAELAIKGQSPKPPFERPLEGVAKFAEGEVRALQKNPVEYGVATATALAIGFGIGKAVGRFTPEPIKAVGRQTLLRMKEVSTAPIRKLTRMEKIGETVIVELSTGEKIIASGKTPKIPVTGFEDVFVKGTKTVSKVTADLKAGELKSGEAFTTEYKGFAQKIKTTPGIERIEHVVAYANKLGKKAMVRTTMEGDISRIRVVKGGKRGVDVKLLRYNIMEESPVVSQENVGALRLSFEKIGRDVSKSVDRAVKSEEGKARDVTKYVDDVSKKVDEISRGKTSKSKSRIEELSIEKSEKEFYRIHDKEVEQILRDVERSVGKGVGLELPSILPTLPVQAKDVELSSASQIGQILDLPLEKRGREGVTPVRIPKITPDIGEEMKIRIGFPPVTSPVSTPITTTTPITGVEAVPEVPEVPPPVMPTPEIPPIPEIPPPIPIDIPSIPSGSPGYILPEWTWSEKWVEEVEIPSITEIMFGDIGGGGGAKKSKKGSRKTKKR
ncbi:hypothetical protein DRP07_00700 [Archaeoglobales archaeon]|nr:MAG: hypothetical protein DRP07_00700 [Archaeoglobales archaeon]